MSVAEKTKILVVDDLPEKILVYQVILEELGQEIVAARSGAEALKHVLAHDFAVILLDVNMPNMDGFETAAMIRARKRSAHTPIIFVTAFTDEFRTAEGYAHGAVDYILAPVVPEVLRAKVRVFVDLFRMTEQVKRQAVEQIALAEERSRRAAAEEANLRLSFLARAGAVLGHSLDYGVTARDVVRLSASSLSDLGIIAQSDPGSGEWFAIEARRRGDELVLEEFRGLGRLEPSWAQAIERALTGGGVECLADGKVVTSQADPTTIIVPLRARGRTFAVLLVSREATGRPFGHADVTMAEALASRAAIALDNARLYKDIEQADRQKNEFLSMLAHELRNPLAPIRNAVAVLRMREEQEPDTLWARDVIDRQVSHLVRLVDDLLDVSRITRGKIRLEFECIDVATLVASAVETSRPLIEAGGHQFHVSVPDEPLWVNADQARIAQVLANLLNNAAKYTPDGGSIWFSAAREGGHAVFRVRDTGMGIPSEMLIKVFELFTQVDRSLDRSQGGLGIGLTLVRRLVEMHGGHVEAASSGPGGGSEFTVRLPAVDPANAEAPQSSRVTSLESGTAAAVPNQTRILVVDDNTDAADSLARLMRMGGHEVNVAYDGPRAVEAARSFRPQVIVLDLGLPGLNGYEVARQLRTDFQEDELLLIALTGYGQEEDHRRSSEAGFDFHFVKPVDFDSLLRTVAAAFANGSSTLEASTPSAETV